MSTVKFDKAKNKKCLKQLTHYRESKECKELLKFCEDKFNKTKKSIDDEISTRESVDIKFSFVEEVKREMDILGKVEKKCTDSLFKKYLKDRMDRRESLIHNGSVLEELIHTRYTLIRLERAQWAAIPGFLDWLIDTYKTQKETDYYREHDPYS